MLAFPWFRIADRFSPFLQDSRSHVQRGQDPHPFHFDMELPDGEKEVKILIPMRLSAYLNYSSAKCNNFVNRPENKAYLSPIPDIRGQDLQGDNPSLQHDIYEHLEPPRPGMEADADRLRAGREGIYLHWSIPDHYRTAIVGSQTTTTMPSKRTKAGYDPLSHVPSDVPVHRPLPDR